MTIEKRAVEKQREISVALLNRAIDNAPRFTGLFASNIGVSFDGTFTTFPSENSRDERGQFFENIEPNRADEIINLSIDELPETLQVGTAVSYAPLIESGSLPTISGNAPPFANAVQDIRVTFGLK